MPEELRVFPRKCNRIFGTFSLAHCIINVWNSLKQEMREAKVSSMWTVRTFVVINRQSSPMIVVHISYNRVTGWPESGRSFPWGRRSPSCGTGLWSTWYTPLWGSSHWIRWTSWANVKFIRLHPGQITLQVQVRYLQLFPTTVAITKDRGEADLHCSDVKGDYSTPSPFSCRQNQRLLKKLFFKYWIFSHQPSLISL